MTPRGAYIHVPFCRHRCGYCNFTLVAGRDELVPAYLQALAKELELLEEPRPVSTLYVGGGTPTHLSPAQLGELCELLARWFPLAEDYEYTFEANPEDISPERLAVLAGAGVNRLSLGIQSFDAAKLQVLERGHSPAGARQAWELAAETFPRVSLDLIFAAPGETLAGWQAELQTAIALGPKHVSTYGLTYESGTSFLGRRERGELSETAEEPQRAMYETGIAALTAAGLEHYEVSSFAAAGHRSRHNELYWSGGEYYAAGPGAARHVAGVRETNHKSTVAYIQRVLAGQSPVAEREELSAEDRARERLVFGLRRLEGLDTAEFAAATGFELVPLGGPAIARFMELGLLEQSEGRIKLTHEGLLVSDSMWPDLIVG